jgi:outer membrane protein TolC
MSTFSRAVSLGLLAVAAATPVHGESLSDAWRMALESDGSLAAIHSARAAADDDQRAASRMRWPVVDVIGSYTKMQASPYLDIETPAGRLQSPKIWANDRYAMGSAEVSIPLWTSGRISGAIGAARAGARGAGAQEVRGVADLKLAVAEAYVGVFRARAAADVAQSNVTSLKAHADDVQVMFDKEVVAQSDLLAAKVALANALQQQLRATNGLRISTAAYNRFVGRPMDRAPELDAPVIPATDAGSVVLSDLVKTAVAQRPELAALAAQQDAYDASARSERAQALPQVGLRAGVSHMDNQILDRQDFASVGVGFQWRLFDSGQVSARVSALRNRARATGQQLDDLRSRVALEVESAVLDREDAGARLRVAGEAVAQSEENLRLAKELYGSGLGTNTQVLDAAALRVMALTNRDSASFDLIIAEYRVRRAVGGL